MTRPRRPTTASLANGGYKATAEGTYKWLAVYSGDDNNNGAVSNCVEQFSIDNDNTN